MGKGTAEAGAGEERQDIAVYLLRDENGQPLYVGQTSNLASAFSWRPITISVL
jgi:hypothetical protein